MFEQTNGMRKLAMVLTLILITCKVFADDYDEDDDPITMADSFYMALIGGGILLAGFLLSQVKFIKGLGQVLMAIGGIVAFLGVFGIVMVIVSAVVSVAVKIALVIGAIVAAVLIIRWIYLGITGQSNSGG